MSAVYRLHAVQVYSRKRGGLCSASHFLKYIVLRRIRGKGKKRKRSHTRHHVGIKDKLRTSTLVGWDFLSDYTFFFFSFLKRVFSIHPLKNMFFQLFYLVLVYPSLGLKKKSAVPFFFLACTLGRRGKKISNLDGNVRTVEV